MTNGSGGLDPMARWTVIGAIAAVIGVVVAVLALGRDAADYEHFAKPTPAETPQSPGTEATTTSVAPPKGDGLTARQRYVREADAACRPWLARTGQVNQSQVDE